MTYKRKEIIGECTLYLGDCLEVMPTLGKVDAVVTDPPFEAQAHKACFRTQKSIKAGVRETMGFSSITEDLRSEVSKFSSTENNGWFICFSQAEGVAAWRDAIVEHGGKYKRTSIWVKPDSSPQFNGEMPAQGYESICMAWCGEGRSRWNGGGKRGVFTHLTNQPDREGTHPTEKPIPLMRDLVQLFTNSGETILDPFMGSGTTGVACAKLGRKFIGIELEEKYFDIACKRIEEAYQQPDMFIEAAKRPTQEVLI